MIGENGELNIDWEKRVEISKYYNRLSDYWKIA